MSRQHARPRQRRISRRITLAAGGAGLFLLAAWLGLRSIPLPEALFHPPPAQIELTDRTGTPLRIVRPADQPFGRPATYQEIPQSLIQATLAAEDRRFWRHPGLDWRGVSRAAWGLVRYRRIVSGGSTITQQLIKLARPRPRTFPAKFIEALQARRLEWTWDKQRILTEYLNRLDYGNLTIGCAAAAELYFGKPLRDLSTAECALLAGVPQGPSRLNPFRHLDRARKRQQWILGRMLECGFVTAQECDRARSEELRLASPQHSFEAPHFVDLLLQERDGDLLPGETNTGEGRRTIRTSLDQSLNRFVQATLNQQLSRLSSQHVENAAAVVLDNRTGGVLALVGSGDYFAPRAGQVNGAWAPRSAGSTFKPFTYLIAFEQGATPASLVADVPTEFATATGLFAPVNYDHRCRGPMRYRLALANSLNIAAVKVLASIGGPAVLQERLEACGLTTLHQNPEHYGLGLTIGNAEARLLELANAYACLARLGEFRRYRLLHSERPRPQPFGLADPSLDPTETHRETSPTRELLRPGTPAVQSVGQRVFEQSASFLIADILSDNAARLLAFGPDSSLHFDFPVACKTGTSSDFRDNWAFGYTPEFTVGVWVGNFDGSPMQGISGVTGAAPILHEVMEYLHQRFGTSWFSEPANLVQLPVHPITGHRRAVLSAAPTESIVLEKFVVGHLPPQESDQDYDACGRIRLPSEYHDWLDTSDNWLAGKAVLDIRSLSPALNSALSPEMADPTNCWIKCETRTRSADRIDYGFRIVFPLPGTKFFLDPDLPDQGRRVSLRTEGATDVQWECDTLPFSGLGPKTTALLCIGRHQLRARNPATGQVRETWIEVAER